MYLFALSASAMISRTAFANSRFSNSSVITGLAAWNSANSSGLSIASDNLQSKRFLMKPAQRLANVNDFTD